MRYKKIIVTGPEGSGTNLLTDVVAELLDWPRADPSALQIQRLESLEREMVHHISLPSHRPVVWAQLENATDTLIFGIIRNKVDAIHSTWSRYRSLPMRSGWGIPTMRDFRYNYERAKMLVQSRTSLTLSYRQLCGLPEYHLQLLCSRLRIPPWSYDELSINLKNQNGKWRKNREFIQEWTADDRNPS